MKKLVKLGDTQAKKINQILYEEYMSGKKIASKFSIIKENDDNDYPQRFLVFNGSKLDYDFYGSIMYRLGMWMQLQYKG